MTVPRDRSYSGESDCVGLLRNLAWLGRNGGSSIIASETSWSLTVFWNLSMHATMFAPNF